MEPEGSAEPGSGASTLRPVSWSCARGLPTDRGPSNCNVSITGSFSPKIWGSLPFRFAISPVGRFRILKELTGKSHPGSMVAQNSSQPPALAHLRAAFAGLAQFHERLACEQTEGVSPGLKLRTETITHLVDGGLDRLETAIQRRPDSPRSHSAAA